jgi:serine/threonine protein kinase
MTSGARSGQPQTPAAAGGLGLGPGARPLPEYALVRLLGRGGFGEVWLARGPGGFDVALKLIRLGDLAGDAEVRALELMKSVRHPHLLALFGAWRQQDLLLIAMELADRTLLDRFRQAQAQGLPGIPRDELLEHLREAARGLDFLNERARPLEGGPAGIVHRDVKPHNLLLVGGSVKVGDFGLAKLLEQFVAGTQSGSLTPAYAAPELFAGRAGRRSDQYSLAVSYCQLRAGRLPFAGSLEQVVAGHLMQPPDLAMLPETERPAVARALAKSPEERWPSCRDFVEALASPPAPVGEGKTEYLPPESGRPRAETTWPLPARMRWGKPALAAAVTLLGLALVGVALWRGPSPDAPEGPERGQGSTPVSVDLSGTRAADTDLGVLRGQTDLRKLDLTGKPVTDAGLEPLRGMTGLRELRLWGCAGVGDDGLTHLQNLSALETLDLSWTAVTDAGLAHLKDLPQLRDLRLWGCDRLGDRGVAALRTHKKLQVLNLSATGVTDAGLVHLRDLAELRDLHLAETRVTDAGLENLRGLTALEALDLSGTGVSEAAVRKLRQALPKLKAGGN